MKGLHFLSQNHKKESKQRFGEFKFEQFGGSDAANKLLAFGHTVLNMMDQGKRSRRFSNKEY